MATDEGGKEYRIRSSSHISRISTGTPVSKDLEKLVSPVDRLPRMSDDAAPRNSLCVERNFGPRCSSAFPTPTAGTYINLYIWKVYGRIAMCEYSFSCGSRIPNVGFVEFTMS